MGATVWNQQIGCIYNALRLAGSVGVMVVGLAVLLVRYDGSCMFPEVMGEGDGNILVYQ